MSSHYWSWFGDGGIAANMTQRDWRGKIKKYLISIHFRLNVLNSSLPVSVCLVIGGATVAGLKAGPESSKKKSEIQTFFLHFFLQVHKGIKNDATLTFLDTFTDTIRLLEEVVVVALATTIQEVFAFSCVLVVVPAWEGALTWSHDRSHSTGICGGGGGEATSYCFNLIESDQITHDFSINWIILTLV